MELCVGRSAFPQGHRVVDDAIGYVARTKKDLRPILATIKVSNKVVFTLRELKETTEIVKNIPFGLFKVESVTATKDRYQLSPNLGIVG